MGDALPYFAFTIGWYDLHLVCETGLGAKRQIRSLSATVVVGDQDWMMRLLTV